MLFINFVLSEFLISIGKGLNYLLKQCPSFVTFHILHFFPFWWVGQYNITMFGSYLIELFIF